MPVGLVKTRADEALWEKAKAEAKKTAPDDFWALTTHIFKNMKKRGRKKVALYEVLREQAVDLVP